MSGGRADRGQPTSCRQRHHNNVDLALLYLGYDDRNVRARSDLSATRITTSSTSSGNGRCKVFASSHGAHIQTVTHGSSGCIGSTTFGAVEANSGLVLEGNHQAKPPLVLLETAQFPHVVALPLNGPPNLFGDTGDAFLPTPAPPDAPPGGIGNPLRTTSKCACRLDRHRTLRFSPANASISPQIRKERCANTTAMQFFRLLPLAGSPTKDDGLRMR